VNKAGGWTGVDWCCFARESFSGRAGWKWTYHFIGMNGSGLIAVTCRIPRTCIVKFQSYRLSRWILKMRVKYLRISPVSKIALEMTDCPFDQTEETWKFGFCTQAGPSLAFSDSPSVSKSGRSSDVPRHRLACLLDLFHHGVRRSWDASESGLIRTQHFHE
jgi:hypothetical protein